LPILGDMMNDDWLETDKLHFAAMDGDVSQISELIAAGHPLDRYDHLGNTALHYAVQKGHLGAVSFLIQAGADVNAHDERVIGDTPLATVAGNCSLQMALILVDAGADPTIRGWMQLCALDRAKNRKRGDGPSVYELLVQTARKLGKR
jgi:ankyrin repeat protein